MNYQNPIYTEKTECQDCYKCLRNCPVKAIKVEGGAATVIPELCILCGHCVEVCPNNAKRVRDDLASARQLLQLRPQVYVSLAPSFISEFDNVRPDQLIAALRKLGFAGVSETALGAQEVSAAVAATLQTNPSAVLLSTACPTVVAYLQKHRHAEAQWMTPLLSPLLAHCRILRATFGQQIGVIFVGPCISKKTEADTHPDLLDVALTFQDLRRWLEIDKIDPATLLPTADDVFVPHRAGEGAWYPVDGGMIAGIRANCAVNDCSMMSFSGIPAIQKAIEGLADLPPGEGVFLELLACEGGCVNGPKTQCRGRTAAKRSRILRFRPEAQPALIKVPIHADYQAMEIPVQKHSESQVREALRTVGKFSSDDELNCGGCGYDSCLQFGQALLSGKAERTMCVTYMRKLAQKKANALIAKMPSAVVIVSDTLKVLECNAAFAQLFGKDRCKPADEAIRELEGVPLANVLPFSNLFNSVLRSGEDMLDRDIRHTQTILHVSIFTIEKHSIVGGIIQDITRPSVQKGQVIRKAQEVIQKNLTTVQKIAYLLGENAAESEITLNQIIDSFSPPEPQDLETKSDDWRKLYRR